MILQSRVNEKLKTLALHSIVNEAFVGGLPMNASEVTDSEKKMLTQYSHAVLEQLGGFSIVENSLKSDILTKRQRMFVEDVYYICTEAANCATKRVCEGTDCKTATLDDVLDTVSLTDSEYSQFIKKANSLDLDKVSDVIKKKTLNVLKDEREQLEKDDAIDEELKEALAETKDMSDVTTESYLDLVLDKASPRHPVTLFSKINDLAMEMLSITSFSGDDISPVLYKTTFESFIDDLEIGGNWKSAQESYYNKSMEEMVISDEKDRPKLAMLISTIVYTVMETLKTMNLYCPSQDSIKQFVNKNISSAAIEKKSISDLIRTAKESVTTWISKDFSKMPSDVLTKTSVDLQELSEDLQANMYTDTPATESNLDLADLVIKVDEQISKIGEILSERNRLMNQPATESYYDARNRLSAVAQFNKISTMVGRNPLVSEIHIKINDEIGSIAVEGLDARNVICKQSFMDISVALEGSAYDEYLAGVYNDSNLSKDKKPVYLIHMDGRGKKIPLN